MIILLGLIALCNSANTQRLLQEEGEVALGGGWSESHDISEDELDVWHRTVSKHGEGFQGVDLTSFNEPVSVTTQVVAGTNYKFTFADDSTAIVYECPWENILEVTSIEVAKNEEPTATFGGSGGIGPAWTYDSSIEAPQGTKDMGGWTASVYTPEQQAKLQVDENGTPTNGQKKPVPADMNGVKQSMVGSDSGSVGPEWTWNSKVERPTGVKDMGSWKKAVYTEEQQNRLGVDEDGSPIKITDILLNRWGTGSQAVEEKTILGANGHGLPPQTQTILGADGHGLPPQHMLGADGHGIGPEWTQENDDKVILGANGHGLPPQQILGADGHGLPPQQILGANGHGLPPQHILGANGHGLPPQEQKILGADGHGLPPQQILGANGHGLPPQHILGANGHGLPPQEQKILGADGHGLPPQENNKPMLGANGHGLGPQWTRGGIMLGSAGRGEGPRWTYDNSMEKPAGEKDMGDYQMKIYTPEQQERLGVTELGEKVLKKTSNQESARFQKAVM